MLRGVDEAENGIPRSRNHGVKTRGLLLPVCMPAAIICGEGPGWDRLGHVEQITNIA